MYTGPGGGMYAGPGGGLYTGPGGGLYAGPGGGAYTGPGGGLYTGPGGGLYTGPGGGMYAGPDAPGYTSNIPPWRIFAEHLARIGLQDKQILFCARWISSEVEADATTGRAQWHKFSAP